LLFLNLFNDAFPVSYCEQKDDCEWLGRVNALGTDFKVLLPRRRWVDNIKMDPIEIGWDGMYWMALAQGRDQ
jgi:hypothetical protein